MLLFTSKCVGIVRTLSNRRCESVQVAKELDIVAEYARRRGGENISEHVRQ